MESRDVVDADFSVIERPWRVPWWGCFWFCVYVGGFAWVAAEWAAPGYAAGVVTMVIGAALVVPAGQLIAASYRALSERVSEPEAQWLRLRLLDPRATEALKRELARNRAEQASRRR